MEPTGKSCIEMDIKPFSHAQTNEFIGNGPLLKQTILLKKCGSK